MEIVDYKLRHPRWDVSFDRKQSFYEIFGYWFMVNFKDYESNIEIRTDKPHA